MNVFDLLARHIVIWYIGTDLRKTVGRPNFNRVKTVSLLLFVLAEGLAVSWMYFARWDDKQFVAAFTLVMVLGVVRAANIFPLRSRR